LLPHGFYYCLVVRAVVLSECNSRRVNIGVGDPHGTARGGMHLVGSLVQSEPPSLTVGCRREEHTWTEVGFNNQKDVNVMLVCKGK